MGPFMVEIVFCRVTRRGRKKGKGLSKALLEANKNAGGGFSSFIPQDDMIKVTLDLSDNGPVFSAMDQMMMAMMDEDNDKKKGGGANAAKDSLKRLMKSGIPGVEKLFTGPGQGGGMKKKGGKGFHKMNDASKQKFMIAIFGEDGTSIEAATAAALLAATCSGGDPEIGNNLAQLLVPEMGDGGVDKAMMAALMSACSMINAGASTEEVMKAMKAELKASGMSDEDILKKSCILMKAFKREDASASIAEYNLPSKQRNVALKQNGTSPKDFTLAVLVMKAITACGSTPENVAKIIMIENQLAKKGAQSRYIADALKHLGDFDKKRPAVLEKMQELFNSDKITRDDVFLNCRMASAIESENEPTWKEVKNMKDTLSGCSPSSPEGIELNLAKATKSAGLRNTDIAACLIAQKVMAALDVDPKIMAQIVNIMKTIADNGVPAVEIARVLSDGLMPQDMINLLVPQILDACGKEFQPLDVDLHVKFYDNLKLKANIPQDVIDFIDNKLIQVRCSLEDVADNLVCAQLARGEKEGQVVRSLCSTLQNTGSSSEIIATTMMASLRRVLEKEEPDIMKDIGRTMHEQGTEKDNLQKAMTELLLNLLDEDPDGWDLRQDALKAMENVLKEAGGFPNEIRDFMNNLELPPEPPDPKVIAAAAAKKAEEEAAEAARLAAEEEEAARKAAEEAEAAAQMNGHPESLKNPALDGLMSAAGSRRGSYQGSRRGSAASVTLGGVERRGSYYSDDVSKKATIAMVVDDEPKSIFDMDGSEMNGADLEETLRAIRSGKVTDEDVNKLMTVFNTSGVVSSNSGVVRIRKISDLRNTLEKTNKAFDAALDAAKNRESPQISEENRKLMQEILERSAQNQDEMTGRVTALLAGSALTTKAGVRIQRRDTVEQVDYTAVGDDLSKLKASNARRKAKSEIYNVPLHQATSEQLDIRAADAGIRVQRRSIKRVSLARLRKTSEFSGLRPPPGAAGANQQRDFDFDVEHYRKIVGLKSSKVPMMVYSHGGFSRCFRIARRYQVDGPPVGVRYDDDKAAASGQPAAIAEETA